MAWQVQYFTVAHGYCAAGVFVNQFWAEWCRINGKLSSVLWDFTMLVEVKTCNLMICFSSSCGSCLLWVSEIYQEFCHSVVAGFICWKTLDSPVFTALCVQITEHHLSFYSVLCANNWAPSPLSQKVCHSNRIWISVIVGGWHPILLVESHFFILKYDLGKELGFQLSLVDRRRFRRELKSWRESLYCSWVGNSRLLLAENTE